MCVVAAVVPLAAWALHNGIRYDEPTVARGGRAWVPFLQVFTGDRTISPENGAASRRLAELIQQEVLSQGARTRRLDVTLDAYLRNGSNYETVRLIALSDDVLGEDENYDVLFDSAVEAIREHPGTYVRGVADTFWDFLVQKPLREDVAPREQTAPEAPAPTFEVDGVTCSRTRRRRCSLVGVPYGFVWCASDYIDSCTLADPSEVWSDPDTQERYREIVARVRAWDAELPSREGVNVVPEILNRITPRYPTPPLWLAVGLVALAVRRPRGWPTILLLWGAAFLVLLIHAASQGVAPEFALPVYPAFIVGALAALAGERGRGRSVGSAEA